MKPPLRANFLELDSVYGGFSYVKVTRELHPTPSTQAWSPINWTLAYPYDVRGGKFWTWDLPFCNLRVLSFHFSPTPLAPLDTFVEFA